MAKPLAPLNFFLLYFAYALTTLGFSRLHGPHHDAQKSISTTFPFSEESLITLSLGSLSAISGARSPILRPSLVSTFAYWGRTNAEPITAAIISEEIKIVFFIVVFM